MRVRDDLPLALALVGVLAGVLVATPGAATESPAPVVGPDTQTSVRAVPGPVREGDGADRQSDGDRLDRGEDDGDDGDRSDGDADDGDPSDVAADLTTPELAGIGLPWLASTLDSLAAVERGRAGLTGPTVPASASGELITVPGSQDAPREAATVRQVRVQVEDGLPVDAEVFADFVMGVLNDRRGWGHDDSVAFARTDQPVAISVVLASGALTDTLCAPLRTLGEYSCGRNQRAVLNAERWSDGAEPFLGGGGTLTEYRQYLVNHEVGHLLGRPHTGCPAEGETAPVMLQQSLRMEGCVPNAWPDAEH
ncbi:DUF3152 domain-containing protein [Georgenia subflava]|uniref:DUF3152 domain-containing protein n=1 Tax=Georgenia subflava TaxID=1622177 RepID=A0A6N7EPQ0_9MICO|nr:DUF3152 domain-containing protein [Georgenia subflava]MPV38847.1 DUF3152 domain-containing protein [Georgenia subflava]